MKESDNLKLSNFYQLFAIPQPSQGSIYLFSPLIVDRATGRSSILFGTLNGKFLFANFVRSCSKKDRPDTKLPWEPEIKEIFFPEIGNLTHRDRLMEVYSLHIFQRKSGHQVFIGVTFAHVKRSFDPSSLVRSRASTLTRNEVPSHHAAGPANMTTMPMSPIRLESQDSVVESQEPPSVAAKPSPTKTDTTSSSSSTDSNFFHIYASGLCNKEDSPTEQFLAASSHLLFRQPLHFMPTHLTSLPEERSFDRPTFIVGGGDGFVHVFTHVSRLEFTDDVPAFIRVDDEDASLASIFPEFSKRHISQIKGSAGANETSPVTWTSYYLKPVDDAELSRGVSAVGFRDGTVTLTLIDVYNESQSVVIRASMLLSHFGPILSICLFEEGNRNNGTNLNLLVCPSLEPSLVYSLDLESSANQQIAVDVCELPQPASLSQSLPQAPYVPLSAIVADVDFDGRPEILVGTCDKRILVYKQQSAYATQQPTQHQMNAADGLNMPPISTPAASLDKRQRGCWTLWNEECIVHSPGPIHAMYYGPLLQNNELAKDNSTLMLQQSLSYLAVFTTSGLLIMQHDLRSVVEICKRRLRQLINDQVVNNQEVTSNLPTD